MRILQLTDIHIGGDYDGKFKCKLNFLSTLLYALDSMEPYDMIVITGDLADKNHRVNYEWIAKILQSTNIPYIVLPGNHDDVQCMREVFGEHTVPDCDYFIKYGILFWNNRIDSKPLPDKFDTDVKTAFCHYPVYDIPHTFMRQHALPNAKELGDKLKLLGIKNVFCGHFHWGFDSHTEQVYVHVMPATQCQLDPNTPDCTPTDDLPVFASIILNDNATMQSWCTRAVYPMYMLNVLYDAIASIGPYFAMLNSGIEALQHVVSETAGDIAENTNEWCPWSIDTIEKMRTTVSELHNLIEIIENKENNS